MPTPTAIASFFFRRTAMAASAHGITFVAKAISVSTIIGTANSASAFTSTSKPSEMKKMGMNSNSNPVVFSSISFMCLLLFKTIPARNAPTIAESLMNSAMYA